MQKKKLPSDLLQQESTATLPYDAEEQKRIMYENMNPRRKKFIDKIGYEQWNPFAPPKDPLDMRKEQTQRTASELVQNFLQQTGQETASPEYHKGAYNCALALVNKDESFCGIFDFCDWYHSLLLKEGKTL